MNLLCCNLFISGINIFRHIYLGPVRSRNKENALEEKVSSLAKKMGVRGKIEVVKNNNVGYVFEAYGCSAFGKAGITLPAHLMNPFSEKTDTAMLAHEIAHIKNNDAMWLWMIPVIVAVAVTVLFLAVAPLVTAEFLGFIVEIISLVAYSRFCEQRADLEACKYLTNDEKRAFADWMKSYQKLNLDRRNKKGIGIIQRLWRNLTYDAKGNDLLDFFHPSLSTRIKKIEETMAGQITRIPAAVSA